MRLVISAACAKKPHTPSIFIVVTNLQLLVQILFCIFNTQLMIVMIMMMLMTVAMMVIPAVVMMVDRHWW